MIPTLPGPLTEWLRRNPERAEAVAGVGVFVLVLAVSLLQWGVTDLGWARGVSLGVATGLVVTWYDRRRRRREEQREQALLDQRLQLARELHDAVAGQVAVIGIQAAAARRVIRSAPDDAATALERIEVASRDAVADLRRMLLTLREVDERERRGPAVSTGRLPAGAVVAPEPGLGELDSVVEAARQAGQPIELRIEGERSIELPASVDHAGYRIVQEAVTNAVKHAPGGEDERARHLPSGQDEPLDRERPEPAASGVVAGSRPRAARHRGARRPVRRIGQRRSNGRWRLVGDG